MVNDSLLNPFNADPEDEFPQKPHAVANWTEFYLNFIYDPINELGVWAHIGRHRQDSSIWRATINIYLPHGELLVAKYYGRDGHSRGPGAGPFVMSCIEPMRLWEVKFDGIMRRSFRSQVTQGLTPDQEGQLVKFHLFLQAASPFATHPKDLMADQSWAHFHTEQVCIGYGEFTIRGKTTAVRGVGARDHSAGPRDYTPIEGDMWLMGAFPSGKCILAQHVRLQGNPKDLRLAYVFHGDGSPLQLVELIRSPIEDDFNAPPGTVPADPMEESCRNYSLGIQSPRGYETIEGEILHSAVVTAFSPFHELIGTDFDRMSANQLCESPTRLVWNGEVGYGLRERGLRVSQLRLPTERRLTNIQA
jgi:hypothetical protein